MSFLKSLFSRLSHKSTPIMANNMPLIQCCNLLRSDIEPTRFVRKVEICTALAAGQDAWGSPLEKTHHHTLLRVCLDPEEGTSDDVLLVERVLSTAGSYHSVTPIDEPLSKGGNLFHPEVQDRICTISEGPSDALARDLLVERTITFGDGSSEHSLTLAQLARILDFLSRKTTLVCAGGDCKFQSRSFAFACMAALTPRLPPATTSVRNADENISMNASVGAGSVDDTVFELSAETYLSQLSWFVKDASSIQTLDMIDTLKEQPRPIERALYH